MIQLTIDDNLNTTLIIGNQRIFCDCVNVDVEPGRDPDIHIYGMYAVQSEGEDEHGM